MKVNVPGRVIDFYQGGGAYQAWMHEARESRDWPEADELALFEAVTAGAQIKAKGGYYVRAELSAEAVEALRYWAETLESASADNARDGDADARNDLRAARRALERAR